jgi:hypothetical protein
MPMPVRETKPSFKLWERRSPDKDIRQFCVHPTLSPGLSTLPTVHPHAHTHTHGLSRRVVHVQRVLVDRLRVRRGEVRSGQARFLVLTLVTSRLEAAAGDGRGWGLGGRLALSDSGKNTRRMRWNSMRTAIDVESTGFRAGKKGPGQVSAPSCYEYPDGMSRGETSTHIKRLIPIKFPLILSILACLS